MSECTTAMETRISKLENQFSPRSMSYGYSNGIHKNIPYECFDKDVNMDGRFICVYCKIYQLTYVFVTIYVPPPYNYSAFNFTTKYPTMQQAWLASAMSGRVM